MLKIKVLYKVKVVGCPISIIKHKCLNGGQLLAIQTEKKSN